MDNLIAEFVNARAQFVALLEKFPEDKIEEKLFGKWSLKEVLAHFTAWDRYFTQAVKLLKQGVTMPYWERTDSFNANAVTRTSRLDWQRLRADFIKAGEAFIDTYQKLPKDLEHKIIWKKRNYTPTRFVKINTKHYKSAQLKNMAELLKKWKIG